MITNHWVHCEYWDVCQVLHNLYMIDDYFEYHYTIDAIKEASLMNAVPVKSTHGEGTGRAWPGVLNEYE